MNRIVTGKTAPNDTPLEMDDVSIIIERLDPEGQAYDPLESWRAIIILFSTIEEQEELVRSVDSVVVAPSLDDLLQTVVGWSEGRRFVEFKTVGWSLTKTFIDDIVTPSARGMLRRIATDVTGEVQRTFRDAATALNVFAARLEQKKRELRVAEEAERRKKAMDARRLARGQWEAYISLRHTSENEDKHEALLRHACRRFDAALNSWETSFKEFSDNMLKSDPTHVLGWSGSLIELTAKAKVAAQLKDRVIHGESAKDICEDAVRQLVRMSTSATGRSTSVMSNVVEDCERAAWAQLVDMLHQRRF